MLKQRLITALVLLAILLPLLFHDTSEPFMGFSLLMVSAGAWEWGRLNGYAHRTSVAMGVLFAVILAVLWIVWGVHYSVWVWVFPSMLWILGGAWLLRNGVTCWAQFPRLIRLGSGLLALAFAWMAMAQARTVGVNFLLSTFFLVWAADVFAYFGGRAFGKRKLAPTISPGKSWAGVYTGALGVLIMAGLWVWSDRQFNLDSPSLYTQLFTANPIAALLALFGLTAMSVVGDLVESLVKRSAGFKDSSNLLPGHGGVLDRVDALLPVLPLVMLLTQI